MNGRRKVSLEAKKNRLRRRIIGALGESLGAISLLAAATVLGALFVYVYSTILSSPYFSIREISVRGVKELTEKDILAAAKIRMRSNILSINTDAVAKRISVNPWIKSVYVGRELPDHLVLEVRERTPVALVKQAGALYLMDVDGFVFKKLSRADEVDLAILSGVDVRAKSASVLVGEALKLLERLSAEDQHTFLGEVSEIHVDEVFGLSILTDKGLHLKLGRENFAGKLNQLQVVLADLEKRGLKNGHLFVDLADISKVTVQRKDTLGKAQDRKKGPQYSI
ncbi:MAG: Cell division protein DivIB [Deltaproteobacteria bacterium ADurb.Bin151]|mgnify:CR=1 FL=1|jgi:cell division protein FtsQ|nr:FtsQ-type POTRA domain-containing protein [Smithella sp.]OQB55759.1 MAG: Cell division protein DivIB [Deltaproteobacteria bacterium ADurb.Bin151]HNZ10617.1 FtsQ-type POTRA domain-containing protein [Smithellaceae bacterium]HOG81201.1 FtsQ-type POTRA domain-containing protein [Smithellaceae bacterium]HOQ40610.1 FtsQ-type POTRA domain-containing protein [Smithellaceae bacterium]